MEHGEVMNEWTDKESVSEMIFNGRYTLSVVKWATCWGWTVDTVPQHEGNEPTEWHYLAKGQSRERDAAKSDVVAAARTLEIAAGLDGGMKEELLTPENKAFLDKVIKPAWERRKAKKA